MSMISRQVAELREWSEHENLVEEDRMMADLLFKAADTIEMLSEKARGQAWIPCEERLPSDGQCVIIQHYDTVGKNRISVVGAYYNEQQGFVDTGYGEMWFGNANDDVIAWQPLPDPWKGADDDSNSE